MDGKEKYEVDGKVKNLDKGSILFIEPKSKVRFLEADGNAISIFLDEDMLKQAHHQINMGPKMLEFPFDGPGEGNVPFYAIKSYQNCQELRDIVAQVMDHSGQTNLDFYFELAEKIIIAQNKEFLSKDKLGFKRKVTRFEIYRRLLVVREYLEDNIKVNVTLDELALVACLSKFHLIRTFKAVFGKTPYQYHLDLKVCRINNLLSSNTAIESLNKIAADFGFTEYSVFYKHYIKKFQKKPSIAIVQKSSLCFE